MDTLAPADGWPLELGSAVPAVYSGSRSHGSLASEWQRPFPETEVDNRFRFSHTWMWTWTWTWTALRMLIDFKARALGWIGWIKCLVLNGGFVEHICFTFAKAIWRDPTLVWTLCTPALDRMMFGSTTVKRRRGRGGGWVNGRSVHGGHVTKGLLLWQNVYFGFPSFSA